MSNNFKFDFEFLNNFEDMYFLLNKEGEIIKTNNSVDTTLNTSCTNRKKIFFNLVDDDLKDEVKEYFISAIENKGPNEIKTKFVIDTKYYDINLSFIPYTNEGNDKLCLAKARDVTVETQKESDLQKFYSVAENSVNPLQITDLQGKMIYVNPAFVKASGYSREELIGKNPAVFSSGKHSKKFWKKMWDTITKGKVWVGEVENRRKSGEAFYTQLLISPILDEKKEVTGFFGIHRDLGEKKMLEKQLIHTQKMESIGTLAAGIAHEVGNPLASISALVQVSLRYSNEDLVKEKLQLVKSQVTRISKIIRDLVDFSRPSNYELQLTDVNQNIKEALEIIKVGVKQKNLSFVTEFDENIPKLPLIADQIQQVFVNILLNAVDAMFETDKKSHRLSITTELENNEVIIQFNDTGSGIKEENLTKIFEPFFTTKKEGKGTGLGLWVSYGIIKSFQGDVKVNSTTGEGTTFTITLPIQT